ncbi:hypothetical protein [Collimonas silvisoli]|uniref:hypothetical protein n=1 Tax=Collimonas silvisoli TaxID=2825884 RepID=UPI001B8AAC0A|nr:hypothetical protein [Collimonas silvisoli]
MATVPDFDEANPAPSRVVSWVKLSDFWPGFFLIDEISRLRVIYNSEFHVDREIAGKTRNQAGFPNIRSSTT